jgi:hypothetical protein
LLNTKNEEVEKICQNSNQQVVFVEFDFF